MKNTRVGDESGERQERKDTASQGWGGRTVERDEAVMEQKERVQMIVEKRGVG